MSSLTVLFDSESHYGNIHSMFDMPLTLEPSKVERSQRTGWMARGCELDPLYFWGWWSRVPHKLNTACWIYMMPRSQFIPMEKLYVSNRGNSVIMIAIRRFGEKPLCQSQLCSLKLANHYVHNFYECVHVYACVYVWQLQQLQNLVVKSSSCDRNGKAEVDAL